MRDRTGALTWDQIYHTIADALGVEFKPYHVASTTLARLAPKEYDVEGNLLGDKAVSVVFDCSKLKRIVPGFKATMRYDEGVRRCLAYIQEHSELQRDDPGFDAWCEHVIDTLEMAINS